VKVPVRVLLLIRLTEVIQVRVVLTTPIRRLARDVVKLHRICSIEPVRSS